MCHCPSSLTCCSVCLGDVGGRYPQNGLSFFLNGFFFVLHICHKSTKNTCPMEFFRNVLLLDKLNNGTWFFFLCFFVYNLLKANSYKNEKVNPVLIQISKLGVGRQLTPTTPAFCCLNSMVKLTCKYKVKQCAQILHWSKAGSLNLHRACRYYTFY